MDRNRIKKQRLVALKTEVSRNAALNGGRGSGQTARRISEIYEDKIADLKANFDYVLEGKDLEIKQLGERCNQLLKDKGDLTDKIEKMKCCGNCRFGYCERSSERIDKDGNRTFHNWNEEKEKYCDVGKNGKYQCWEIKE